MADPVIIESSDFLQVNRAERSAAAGVGLFDSCSVIPRKLMRSSTITWHVLAHA